jgi:hypothetical protein
MPGEEVPIDLPGDGYQYRGRLLAQVQASGALPMLQVYRAPERLIAVQRHADGGVRHTTIWLDVNTAAGPWEVLEPRPREEIEADLRAFFAGDPRADALIREMDRY